MKNYIGLIISLIGIFLIAYHIYITAKTEESTTFFLIPLGLVLSSMGSILYIRMNQKKK